MPHLQHSIRNHHYTMNFDINALKKKKATIRPLPALVNELEHWRLLCALPSSLDLQSSEIFSQSHYFEKKMEVACTICYLSLETMLETLSYEVTEDQGDVHWPWSTH